MMLQLEHEIITKQRLFASRLLRVLLGLFLLGLGVPSSVLALEVTLQWDANREPDLAGYVIYYKAGRSGDRVKENYTHRIELTVDQDEYKDDPNLIVHYTIQGLEDDQNYVFVVTAFDSNDPCNESDPSNLASTDNTPPGIISNLTHSLTPAPDPEDFTLEMHWTGAVDPEPGSGLAGYSYVLDAYPDTIPDEILDTDAEATGIPSTLEYGNYWFHIRAADIVGRSGTSQWGETVHYGPIRVGTDPPTLVGKPEFLGIYILVTYSKSDMQNADLADGYIFSDGLGLLGYGVDISGTQKTFKLPMTNYQPFIIYRMTITDAVTDRMGNPLAGERVFTLNDDDGDGMADDWERMWFGDSTSKDGSADADGDDIPDLEEYAYASGNPQWGADRWTLNPMDPDSDEDGIPDGYEAQKGLNPTDFSDRDLDSNGNGVSNYDEYLSGLSAPLINPIPEGWAADWIPYTGPPPSLSEGSLHVTWSLIAGPPGMKIDPITGVVNWPEPMLDKSPYTIAVRAENLAGFDEQSFVLTVVPYHVTAHVNGLSGDDETGEGSLERPWKSIGFALSEAQGSLSPSVTLRVSAGRYEENITITRNGIEIEGGWNSGFRQRWDFVQSGIEPSSEYETLIDGQSAGPVITASSNTTIDGFTLTGGKGTHGGGISGGDVVTVSNCKITGNSADMGGGIYTEVAAVVRNCFFVNNTARVGGGICTRQGSQVVSSCTFKGNSADTGGAIFNIDSSPWIGNCLFIDNTALGGKAGQSGGGIGNESSYPHIVNCTFSGNTAGEYGGAIGNFSGSMATVTNSISWANSAGVSGKEIYNDSGSKAYLSYCDIRGSGGSGGTWDNRIGVDQGGNIDAIPLFVDRLNQNYHLQYLSPCVDAGDPASDYSMEPEPNGGRINLGAYGGTHEATMTPRPVIMGQVPLTTAEDRVLTIKLSNLLVTDPDTPYPIGFTLAVQDGSNYTRSGNTIKPVQNFNGTLTVPVTVSDGELESARYNLIVTVTAVNDAPVITGQRVLTTPKDRALTIKLSDLLVTDPDTPYPTGFSLEVLVGSNYTRSGNAITPIRNFSGLLIVHVRVKDGMAYSPTYNLNVTVTAVKDAPVIVGQRVLTTPEDTALTIALSDLTVSDPDNPYPDHFTLTVQDGANYSLVGHTITPSLNFTGTLTVPVTVNDGATESALFDLAVEVLRDNDGDRIPDIQDPDDENDLMPDTWEIQYGLNPLNPFDAVQDKDGDGHSNLSEYTAGTDPQDPESYPLTTFLVEHITVTDVRPNGFCVVWESSEPANCSLAVYDETGSPLSGIEIVSESAFHPPAEDIGVMKVRVNGLEPGKVYFFQTLTISKLDGFAKFEPYPEVHDVLTEGATTAVNNDLFKQRIYDEEGNPAEGALLLAFVTGGHYPVSGWVGQSSESPWASVALNEVYSEISHQNLQLAGREEMTLWSFGGQLGHWVNVQEIPVPSGAAQAALVDYSYLDREIDPSF